MFKIPISIRYVFFILLTPFPGQLAVGAPIAVEIDAVGSGVIGGEAFTEASFRITAHGDTLGRRSPAPGVFDIPMASAAIVISGVSGGPAAFNEPTRVFATQAGVGGFSRNSPTNLGDLLNISGAAFANWDMLSDIGPVFEATLAPEPLSNATGLATSQGTLSFSAYHDGTFVARIIPEPTAALPTVAATFVGLGRRRGTPLSVSHHA